MEVRVLEYFLAIAREQSISGAAEYLHLTQPTLSRQIKDLEDSLGKQLLIRGNRKITLTEDGMLLRKRAEEILELVNKAESEVKLSDSTVSGDIYIGTAETVGVRHLAKVFQAVHSQHSGIHYHMISMDGDDVREQLDRGLIDFGLIIGEIDKAKYNYIELPSKDRWGVLMRRDSVLASKEYICPEDLWNEPLIVSQQSLDKNDLYRWMKREPEKLNIEATYSLLFNGSLLVQEGMGYALCLDKLINTSGDCDLCFRPLEPRLEVGLSIVWKKYQVFTKAAAKLIESLQDAYSTGKQAK